MKRTVVLALLLSAGAVAAQEIAVTVYNDNLGVVSETRPLEFLKGTNRLAFVDVPSQIDPNSVRFNLTGNGGDVTILEQNYAFDLVSPEQLYAKYIDQQIELVDKEGKVYSGTLLAFSGGAVTLREQDGRVKVIQLANIVTTNFPELPEGLITRPTLFWLYNSNVSGNREAQVSYQTTGLSWSAEYVGVLNAAESQMDLSGWGAISNTSGKTYADAKLKLIAGSIHRAQPPREVYPMTNQRMDMAAEAKQGFEEKGFFEYHMYTLPRDATIANNEVKQISLFDPASTGVKKTYLFRPDQRPDVDVAVEFTNSQSGGLGMPLPAGRVRLFKADEDGSLILLGEDLIKHTPKEEKVDLKIGSAFDVIAENTLINQRQVSSKVSEQQWRTEIRNRKDEAVTVKVERNLWGFWEVVEREFEHEKKDANTLVYTMTVPANDTGRVEYTIRFSQQ